MKNLNDMSDEELALSYSDGNNRAFDVLLERHQSKLFTYIMFVVKDDDLANELFQETFVKVITKLQHKTYASTGKFESWLIRLAHNTIMDWYRHRRVVNKTEVSNETALALYLDEDSSNFRNFDFVNAQISSELERMIDSLPDSQREVLRMHYYQLMPFKEIAELTNVSINTALGRMRYAIINLRRMLYSKGMTLDVL